MQMHNHWINGNSAQSVNGSTSERYSPANGDVIATVAVGSVEDVGAAVDAARRAFDAGAWASTAGSERGQMLSRLADLMQSNLEELAQLEAIEAGKPIKAARMEIGISINLTRYAASLAWSLSGRVITDAGPDKLGLVMQQPRGVAGLIVAWNYPVLCLMQKLPFALAAGCATIVKPSEFTPGTTLLIAKLASEAGIPAGQINVVIGTGDTVGEAMTSHPGIDMISFTGSSKVGRHVAAKCAGSLKHCSLELGGKGSNIVFADADIDRAVEATYIGFTFNKGEECCSSARVLLEESIAEEFSDKLIRRCKTAKLGMPLDEHTEIGPLIHEQHLNRVLHYIRLGKTEGARVLVGGERVESEGLRAGYFVPPTVFDNVDSGMTIFKEEIFGPVACLMKFRTLDEAVSIANDTNYGLANGVWTANIDKAMAVMRRLRSGMVYVNTYLESLPQLPLGGLKESGAGYENGLEGLQEFLETKSALVRLKTTL
ncbi:aldehyde dehydrogenase family protein [Paraburkholderia sp.]|uniref:aldehyde dehydrogenase family protein n=1 Tax=Paraburkholderia sp. TaxID=1926495 RepID=UPI003C799DD3